jgi:hypothetical protein
MREKPKLISAILTASVLFSSQLAYAQQSDWSVGVEREVGEGHYFKLFAQSHGWRVWRIETRDSVLCTAVKSAIGRPHPIPLGYGFAFFGGTPFLTVTPIVDGYNFHWKTTRLHDVAAQYREGGQKFWYNFVYNDQNFIQLDGKIIEISVTSWEYPALNRGYAKETASFNVVGLNQAITALYDCKLSK